MRAPIAVLVLSLAAGTTARAGDPAPAGAAYTRGMQLFSEQKFDEAAAAFEESLRHEPAESPSLRYRDVDGRHRHSYFPQYHLGASRLAQAEREAGPYVRRGRLQAAGRHFGLTDHPEGPAKKAEAAGLLERLEMAIAETEANAVPPEIAQLRAKVDQLCEASSFEDAQQAIQSASELLRKHEKIRNELLATTRNRQRAVLRNYEALLSSRLDSISRTDPTYEAEVVLPLLKPARVPPTVMKDPEARFRWLLDFCALYEKELETVKGAGALDPDRLLPSADAFDTLGRQALEIDLFNGFRASRNLGHAMRMARLRELATAADKPDTSLPGTPAFKSATSRLLDAADAARTKVEQDLAARGADGSEDLKKYLESDLPYQKRQVETVRGKVREVTLAYERRVAAEAAAQAAEAEIQSPGLMADPAEGRRISRALSKLESEAYFETLPAVVRARVLFARAVCDAVVASREADPPSRVAEKCRGDLLRAAGLDAGVHKPWQDAGRLSPRLSGLFDLIRKQ